MELSFIMKLRIAASAAIGAVLIGYLAWPIAAPAEPVGAVSIVSGNISPAGSLILLGLAVLCGFTAYFISWPFGRQIGILAVPSGLAVWALRSGSVAGLMQLNPMPTERNAILATFKWEPFFWLAVVAAGFAGVFLAGRIKPQPVVTENIPNKTRLRLNFNLNYLLAVMVSGVIAQILIRFLAQDVRIPDGRLGAVVAQPEPGQIVFALLVAFGAAGFLVKKFLDCGYIWPIISSAFIMGASVIIYARQNVLTYMAEHHAAIFFSSAVFSILPVQMVAWGTLGSIWGYWICIRYDYWRKHEIG
jgi:hypothetical protein